MIITVFGGSAPKPGETAYEEARKLGQMIARSGHTALTGGYMGTMEAVSLGAKEAGGKAIGATCGEIEKFRPTKANPYLTEEWMFSTLAERLHALCARCDAAIVLPGGAGTLAEVGYLWNHIIIEAIPVKPLVLSGPGWNKTFEIYFQTLGEYTALADQAFLS
ncbi:MAG: LOG family protein, partial [Anaerolineaceae bacterium]|nr:LOG family protein [Anaerolineaceae bacterium]